MAVDAQGAGMVRPYVEAAGATFATLVDETNSLGRLYGYRAVPNLYLIEPDGTVARRELGTFNIRAPADRAALERWAGGDGVSPAHPDGAEAGPGTEAAALFADGVGLYRRGRTDEALERWRRAAAIEPDNYNVRKQIWAVEHPERFYDGRVDYDWQREQIERGA